MHDAETRRAYPFLDLIEAHAPIVREEALAVDPEHWTNMPGYQQGCTGFVLETGRWAHDFPKVDITDHRARCPRTWELLQKIDGLMLGGFMRLAPGARMRVHTDPRDDDMVRCHLGLRLTTLEQAWWPVGAARLMDTRQPHWARNDDDYPRITMVIDVRMPFVVPNDAFGAWRRDQPGPELERRADEPAR